MRIEKSLWHDIQTTVLDCVGLLIALSNFVCFKMFKVFCFTDGIGICLKRSNGYIAPQRLLSDAVATVMGSGMFLIVFSGKLRHRTALCLMLNS